MRRPNLFKDLSWRGTFPHVNWRWLWPGGGIVWTGFVCWALTQSLTVQGGAILREVLTGVSGTAITDLTSDGPFPSQPSATNLLPAGLAMSLTGVGYVPVNLGTGEGSTLIVPGGLEVSGKGSDLGGTSDQCHFAYVEKSGDFDMQVRVASLAVTHPLVQAGLMARESLEATAAFAGVFASSAQLGCYFESRSTAGAQAQTAAPLGGFPANYPHQWLRLRRSGNQFTGYGSFDGLAWQALGSATVTLPTRLYFGMTAVSHDTNAFTTAQFRDIGPVVNPADFLYKPSREPLGPSNRRTGLVFSEIMFHPPDRADGKLLEFVEIYNGECLFVDLTGWRLTGAVQYSFPDGFTLQAGQFAVIALDPPALESVTGLHGVLGPYQGRLNNAGESLKLLNRAGAVRLEVKYSPDAPWPLAADGLGHSLVLARPSYGEDDPRAWSASERVGGSPGEVDAITVNPWAGVVINEFLAHTDDPVLDFVELFNSSLAPVNLSGCFLSDDPSTNRFRIPDGTVLGGRSFISFNQNQLGFALKAAGETLYLLSSDKSRVLDVLRMGGQENGVSSGRWPDGSPTVRRLINPTPGAANAPWRVEDVVINEIMYHPISGDDRDQYVELFNQGPGAVDLSGWRLGAGIDYRFPAGAVIPSHGYVVVAKDAARLRTNYAQLNLNNTFGDFSDSLSRSGERLILTKPDLVVSTNREGRVETNTIHVVVSEVSYRDGGRWPELADGGGSSLELIDPGSDLLRPSNWAASDETQKAPWTAVEYTGRLDLGNGGYSNNRLQVLMQGAGECLVDEVEVFRVGSTNLLANGGFENGATGWTFFGNHRGSSVENGGAAAGQACLHVRALGDGDTANNAIRATMSSTIASGQTATIRAKVRWLAGWPEILFRLRGNWIELPARMEVPRNLGTPGQPNSRRVDNAGPAIYDVSHDPALPRANEPVVVTCRVSDPDGVGLPQLRFRVDPAATLSTVTMRDDGTGGDAIAGDGIYSGTISGRSSRTLVAFRIEASDDAPVSATSVFPADAPARECLIRWDDPVPFGTFAHYHMWNTTAIEQARAASRPLDNTYRDCTLVYGNWRIIYNAGFRDKGSPYHGGAGDFAVTVPSDDLLLGTDDRVFGSTGNGGEESGGTAMKGDVSAWIGQQMGIPYLHSHYMRLYRNGSPFRKILYDLEQPNRRYARDWFGGGGPGDELYKIAVWFEFADDNSNFQATGATIERFLSEGAYKMARYRWNWQIRPSSTTANSFQSVYNLVTAANTSNDRVTGLMNLADMEEWMRVFAFNRVLGNWDAWTFSVGQNMFLYAPLGSRAGIMPWDIDFVLGDGNGASDALWGGQDPVANQLYNVPTYRRMLWRAYQDAINGPMRPEQYSRQLEARRTMLLKNGVTGLTDPRSIGTYLDGRRNYIQRQLDAADAKTFSITSNSGTDFTTDSPVVTLTGTAPFAVAEIDINGIPYPVAWTGFTAWRISVPMGAATNTLQLTGRDLRGQPVPGATASVTIRYTGAVPEPQDWVVLNEIMYHPPVDGSEFIELFNRHPSMPFDLSGFQLSGVGFTFPSGSLIAPNSYVVLVKDRAAFAGAYGSQIPVLGEFSGQLDNGGETLRLVKPEAGGEVTIDDVRYDDSTPWPSSADGGGPSLQLIDPAQDNWRAGNWMATAVDSPNQATPGRANAAVSSLDPFPPLWINEVLPNNQAGALDNQGQREPWIELYNAGAEALDLSAYFLSNDPNEPARWPFPLGTRLGPKQFLLLWADGQPAQSTSTALHTSFRLASTGGLVLLTRMQLGAPAVMDYVAYSVSSPDVSFGSVPDGEPRKRRLMLIPTPGAPNNPSSPIIPVTFNEWMAGNDTTLADPADGQFEDWFELYNAGTTTVDLSGYYLTDNLTNTTQFRIPNGTLISPGGFRLFWADSESDQNAPGRDIHTNFRLSAASGQIGLIGLDGVLVDAVTYGPQTTDISQGRFPDGTAPPFFFFATSTPGAPNSAQGANRPPVLQPIADRVLNEGQTLTLKAEASDPDLPAQTLVFDLPNGPAGASINPATGELRWTPTVGQGVGTYSFTVRVTDNGTPARSAMQAFLVSIVQVNLPPVLAQIPDALIDEGVLYSFRLQASDANLPPQQLTFSLGPEVPDGAAIDPVTGDFTWIPTEDQGPGTYTLKARVTDDGHPPLAAERTFTLTVREVNNAPLVTEVSAQSVDEGATLRLLIEARDPDTPPAPLTYSLVAAPNGATIDPQTGVFTWTPSEADGPRDHNVTVRVSEPGGGPSTDITFLVGVREVNTAPTLVYSGPFTLRPGDVLVLTNHASDSDLPAQTLSFSSPTPLPTGATLDPATGVFRWQVPDDPMAGLHRIIIRVTDDGSPPLSTDVTLEVTIQAPPRIAINEIMHRPGALNAEYVELMNYSATNPLDLSGWRLEGYSFLFPLGTVIPPSGYLCVARNLAAFRAAYGAAPAAVGNAVVTLGTEGGVLRLWKTGTSGNLAEVADEVRFQLRPPWPEAAASQGASLQLIDPRQDHQRVGNWGAALGAVTNAPVTVTTMTSTWKYWESPSSPGTGWNLPTFNDASWASGPGLLYVESAALPAPKSTPLTLGSTTFYFRSHFTFNGSPDGARLLLSTVIDDGAIFYLNGQEIFRIGMPAGAVTHATFASRTVGDAALEGPFDIAATGLRAGDNVLAVEVHQINSTSSDVVFGMTADLVSIGAASYTPGAPNSIRADLPPFPLVWINEILPHNVSGLTDNMGDRDPWIELFNAGAEALSLNSWSMTDDYSALAKWSFPTGASIPSHGFLLVWADGEPGESVPGTPHTSFRINPTAGSVALARPQGAGRVVVDWLDYNVPGAGQSFGSVPDGVPDRRQVLLVPSPAAQNSGDVTFGPELAVEFDGANLKVAWPTVPGTRYQLQVTTRLGQPDWQTAAEFVGDGSLHISTQSISTAAQALFYRVVIQ